MVERGQVWRLGRHRLLCGDATSKDDVEKLMNGNKANLMLTDPPYGVNIVNVKSGGGIGGTIAPTSCLRKSGIIGTPGIAPPRLYEPVIGDDSTDSARDHFNVAKDYTKNQIIFGGNYFTEFLPPHKCWIVWDKQNGQNNNFADGELAWTSFDKPLKIYQWRWAGMIRKGKRSIELKERIHPTQKPVGMLQAIIEDFTEENATVLDCFAGSGSTLIACELSGRTCYTMELSESYCEKIIDRWETITGEKAELLN